MLSVWKTAARWQEIPLWTDLPAVPAAFAFPRTNSFAASNLLANPETLLPTRHVPFRPAIAAAPDERRNTALTLRFVQQLNHTIPSPQKMLAFVLVLGLLMGLLAYNSAQAAHATCTWKPFADSPANHEFSCAFVC